MPRFLDVQGPAPSDDSSAARRPNTPATLGDTLAHLTWESYSDELLNPETHRILELLGIPLDEGVPPQRVAEEILILLLWTHTRTVELAFVGRAPAPDIRKTLDAFHSAVFQDMAENGTPPAQLPIFEQRVSARYAEYHQAAEMSGEALAKSVTGHLAGLVPAPSSVAVGHLVERVVTLAEPLRDFLRDVDLTEG